MEALVPAQLLQRLAGVGSVRLLLADQLQVVKTRVGCDAGTCVREGDTNATLIVCQEILSKMSSILLMHLILVFASLKIARPI